MQNGEQDNLIGMKLGHYEVMKRLGRGGMGSVYLAHDRSLDRLVALKVMLASLAQDESVFTRFKREARAVAQLNHPNIVQVYSVGVDKNTPFIAMEFVDGESVEAMLLRQRQCPWQQAISVAAQVAAALECAHEKGIIHRDIKPSNLLMDTRGRVRVADFGLAKVDTAATQLTSAGVLMGTPHYMSPEQCGTDEVGPSSDLFSLGVVLYEMLAGQRPFTGETPAGLVRSITLDTPRSIAELVPDLPPEVSRLVMRLLAKTPDTRFPSGRELGLALQGMEPVASDGSNIGARTVITPIPPSAGLASETVVSPFPGASAAGELTPTMPSKSRMAPVVLAAIAVALAALSLGVGLLALRLIRERPDPVTASNETETAPDVSPPEPSTEEYAAGDQVPGEPLLPPADARWEEPSPGLVIADLGNDLLNARPLDWTGHPPALLAHGVRGSLDRTAKRQAMVLISPQDRAVHPVRATAFPLAPGKRPLFRSLFAIPRTHPGASLHNTIMMIRPARDSGESYHQELVASTLDPYEEHPVLLFSPSGLGKTEISQGGILPGACSGFAVHPNGRALCLIMSKEFGDVVRENYLLECRLTEQAVDRVREIPVESGRISRVWYSPDGEHLVVQRGGSRAYSELWLLAAGYADAGEPSCVFTAKQPILTVAISPAGTHMIVALGQRERADLDLILVDLTRPAPDNCEPIGAGMISAHPWMPGGSHFVGVTTQSPGSREVWGSALLEPKKRHLLTSLPTGRTGTRNQGVLSAPIVSMGGDWIAVEISAQPLKLAFLDVEKYLGAQGKSAPWEGADRRP